MRLPGLLVGVYVVVALLWGPSPSLMGVPHLIRVLYLLVLPGVVWMGLIPIWRRWHPDRDNERWLFMAATVAVAVLLFVAAALAAQADSHLECTELQKVGYQDAECVGEYISVPGPNRGIVFFLALGGAISLFVGWSARNDNG